MPLGAPKLTQQYMLDRIKPVLRLDLSCAPTFLRWADDYHSVRTAGGEPAGSQITNGTEWAVTANRVPLYCRHAVWMLANDEPLPEGHDIAYADGNNQNLHPSNLTVVTYQGRRVGLATRAKYVQYPHTLSIKGSHTFLVTVHVGAQAHPIAVTATQADALAVGLNMARHFGYMPGEPSTHPLTLKPLIDAIGYSVPTDAASNLRWQRAKASFTASIIAEVTRYKQSLIPAPSAAQAEPVRPTLAVITGGVGDGNNQA